MLVEVNETEVDCLMNASQADTNGFAQIPKMIETNNVPILDSNILIKWTKSNGKMNALVFNYDRLVE